MRKEILYTITIFISGIIHLLILLISWKLKEGQASLFALIPWILSFSFLLNILLFLKISGLLSINIKNEKQEEASPPEERKRESSQAFREIVDPKTSVEKLLKNTLLKRSKQGFGEKLLSNFSRNFDIVQGIFFDYDTSTGSFRPIAFYAISDNKKIREFSLGEGINGQACLKDEPTILKDIPESWRMVESGLGNRTPAYIYFVPLRHENNCLAMLEISTFKEVSEQKLNTLTYFTVSGGKKYNQFLEKVNV